MTLYLQLQERIKCKTVRINYATVSFEYSSSVSFDDGLQCFAGTDILDRVSILMESGFIIADHIVNDHIGVTLAFPIFKATTRSHCRTAIVRDFWKTSNVRYVGQLLSSKVLTGTSLYGPNQTLLCLDAFDAPWIDHNVVPASGGVGPSQYWPQLIVRDAF
jgi:hypothetical protein